MGKGIQPFTRKERMSGKWQVPVFALSVIVLAAALVDARRRIPSDRAEQSENQVRELESLVSGGQFGRAIDLAERLVLVASTEKKAIPGAVYLSLARALFGRCESVGKRTEAFGREIVETFERARVGGCTLTSEDMAHIGRAYEWQNRWADAVSRLGEALQQGHPNCEELSRHQFELQKRHLGGSTQELHEVLDRLLGACGEEAHGQRLWVLEKKVALYQEAGELGLAQNILLEQASFFSPTVVVDEFEVVRATVLLGLEQFEEAEQILRGVRNRIDPEKELHAKTGWLLGRVLISQGGSQRAEEAMSFFRDVLTVHPIGAYAVASLFGRGDALAALDRHSEAIETYTNAVHELEAEDEYSAESSVVDRSLIWTTLGAHAESRRAVGQLKEAVSYAQLAATLSGPQHESAHSALVRQVAQLQWQLAEELQRKLLVSSGAGSLMVGPSLEEIRTLYTSAASHFLQAAESEEGLEEGSSDPNWKAAKLSAKAAKISESQGTESAAAILSEVTQAQVRLAERLQGQLVGSAKSTHDGGAPSKSEVASLFSEAAETQLRLSRIAGLEEQRTADAAWRAAELFAKAGQPDRAVDLFREFAVERPSDSRVPKSYFTVGDLRRSSGRLREAIEAYQDCYRRFPKTLEGARALVPLAETYLALGHDQMDLAESTLRLVVEDSDIFTPQAPEFVTALYRLGQVRHRRGAFERAIEVFEEALARAPEHAEAGRSSYLLADCYRQSGRILRKDAEDGSSLEDLQRIREESNQRLRRAQDLFHRWIEGHEVAGGSNRGREEDTLLRLARLYEADCLFELRDFRAALNRYESIIRAYGKAPAALAAAVQVIHCRVFLGEADEARTVWNQAVALLDSMPAVAFEAGVSPRSRSEWQEYLKWLGESEMF
ncbi:MAG: tetratricopeptide repeat protein [Planctomycetota bacterium]